MCFSHQDLGKSIARDQKITLVLKRSSLFTKFVIMLVQSVIMLVCTNFTNLFVFIAYFAIRLLYQATHHGMA